MTDPTVVSAETNGPIEILRIDDGKANVVTHALIEDLQFDGVLLAPALKAHDRIRRCILRGVVQEIE